MTDAERLDRLAAIMPTAEMTNAIHACREGHPLGRGNPYKWRNALFMIEGRYLPGLDHTDAAWLRRKAAAEAAP